MSEPEATGGDTLLSPEPATASTWYGEESKGLVESKGWKTADDALKSYSELEKSYSGRVKMLTPESSAEEIRAFYQKTGCPENVDGYEVAIPEGIPHDESVVEDLKTAAYEMGVSKQGFEAIANKYFERMATDMAQQREQGEAALKEELGDKYDEELTIAKRFCETCSDEFRDLLEQTGIGNNPVFIKEFINKGKQIMGDSIIQGSPDSGEAEKGYVPQYPDSPDMYKNGDSDESIKARKYFEARGHKY